MLGGVLALGALGLASCSPFAGGYRYKLFVEVEVDGRRYSGQGVRATEIRNELSWPSAMQARRTRGEAFWIDIPGKPTLFVILPAYDGHAAQEWNPDLYLKVPRTERVGWRTNIKWERIQSAKLDPGNVPGLVYFSNIDDPASGHFLNPRELDQAYGARARVVSARVEQTREPLQQGIKKKIPWLSGELKRFRRNPTIDGDPKKYIFNVTQFYSEKW